MESGEKIVTIQQTSKRYKAAQLAGVVAMCMGTVSCVAQAQPVVNGLFWIAGCLLFGYARIGAWWKNG